MRISIINAPVNLKNFPSVWKENLSPQDPVPFNAKGHFPYTWLNLDGGIKTEGILKGYSSARARRRILSYKNLGSRWITWRRTITLLYTTVVYDFRDELLF